MKLPTKRWSPSRVRPSIDYLLSEISQKHELETRLEWFSDLMWWIRLPKGIKSSQLDFASGQGQHARVRYILHVLQRNRVWKLRVAKTLRSIVQDTDAIDLFSRTGLPSEMSLFNEATERLMMAWLPPPPLSRDIGELFSKWFPSEQDAEWVGKLDDQSLVEILALLNYGLREQERGWNSFIGDMEDAIVILASQVRVQGLSSAIRKRSNITNLRESSFYHLVDSAQDYIKHRQTVVDTASSAAYRAFMIDIGGCVQEIRQIYGHLSEFGVNVNIVYQLDRMEGELQRIKTLAHMLSGEIKPREIVGFFAHIIRESAARRSVAALFRENMALLSRRIAERNAETGGHYITRSREEYRSMLKRACGGGLITAPAVMLKAFSDTLSLPYFIQGGLNSSIYITSFLAIQGFGFTLATKQPAMTAPSLAASLSQAEKDQNLEPLLDEITDLVRSQVAAIIGNITTVVPVVAIVHFAYLELSGKTLLTLEFARPLLEKHFILGPTPLYAAFTGVILWISSLFAGYLDNWAAYRQVPDALRHHRMLNHYFGRRVMDRCARLLQRHIPGFGANVSLGLMLGMTPKIGGFFGLPLDVRHVTLSSGMVTMAALSIGPEQISLTAWLQILCGLGVIGLCNLGVSFSLALFVAINARKVKGPARQRIYRGLLRRLAKQPARFFLPRPSTGH